MEYTSSQRRRHAGHGSDSVYDQYYAPTNPGTDGQAAYVGDTPRTLPSKLLRLLKMDHNPELAQTLPARELHELVTGDQYSAVFAELESLPDSDDATIKKERAEILGRLRGLKLAALKTYREKQKEKSVTPSSTPILSPRLVSASGVSATRTFLRPCGCSGFSIKPRGSLISRKSTSRNRLAARFPPARIQSALNDSRSLRTGTSIFMTFTAGSLGNQRQVSSVVVPARRRKRRVRRAKKNLLSVDGVQFDA